MQSSAPIGKQPTTDPADTMKAWWHRLLIVLLAAVLVLVLVTDILQLHVPGKPGWPEALLLLLATAGTLTALARQLPLQNVLLAAFVIALMGGAAHALGVTMGIPFGPFLFSADAGPRLFKTLPWALPLIWVVVILNSRGVARLILRPWRKNRSYGFWLIGLTALLTAGFDLALDPYAARVEHYWFWLPTKFPVTWQGAPLVNFLSWATVALLMLAFVTPALINKNPVRRPPDFHPLAVWLGAILWFGMVAARHEMWLAAGIDGIMAVLVATFAIRGGRW
jgi:uncharacterized membrane protein